jgi:hypothetical protein
MAPHQGRLPPAPAAPCTTQTVDRHGREKMKTIFGLVVLVVLAGAFLGFMSPGHRENE